MKKKENLSFAITWVNPEDITLSERRQSRANTVFHLHVKSQRTTLIKTERGLLVARSGGMADAENG